MRKDVSREQSLEVIAKFAQNFPFSELSSEDAQKFIKNPKKFCALFAENLKGEKNELFPQETPYLRLIGETSISATKASTGINQNNKYPFDWLDSDFDKLDVQTVSKNTGEAEAFVYEQVQNGTYAQIFGSFNKNLDVLEFETHEQIKDFVKNSPELLHPKDYATHFLYKSKSGERFVVRAYRNPDGDLNVYVGEFSSGFVWDAAHADRFVILVTKTLDTQS